MEQKFGINSLNLQVLREFCDPDAFKVYLIDKGSAYKAVTLSELLPYGFGPDFIK